MQSVPSNERFVDIDEQQESIRTYPSANVNQLFEFGKGMAESAHQTLAQLDSKLGNYLAFSAALIGLLSVGSHACDGVFMKVATVLALASLIAAIGSAFVGLRVRVSYMPSELDWFESTLVGKDDVVEFKRYHVISLLISHQHASTLGSFKAKCAELTEMMLGLGAVIAGLQALVRVF